MESEAGKLARRLAEQALAVCETYLSNGVREGRYWTVGDVHNTPGRSLYVRLAPSSDGRRPAGKWTDAQSGEHGDLLDIIALSRGHRHMRDTLDEARRFLALPRPEPRAHMPAPRTRAPTGTPEAARRLFAGSRSIAATLAERHLKKRGIVGVAGEPALRFHPRCHYRPSRRDAPGVATAWPALIAAITDLGGTITGVHRTWLDPARIDKAPVARPRKAMGEVLGHGIRFGAPGEAMAAGEGVETILSLRMASPALPLIAATSAAHLAAILFPSQLRRLYVAREPDPSGANAYATLAARAGAAGIEVSPIDPILDDHNEDLRLLGLTRLRTRLVDQLAPNDRERFVGASR